MTTIATHMLTVIAQTPAPTTPATNTAAGKPGDFNILYPMMIVMVIWFFFSIRSKRRTEKERSSLLNSMKRGDRVQTIGGILGTIVDARDNEVVVKVDESNNTKIKFARTAISRVMGEEEKPETK